MVGYKSMKSSLGKVLWKSWSWLFNTFINLFFILDIAVLILIIIPIKPNFNDLYTLFPPLLIILSIASLTQIFPVWIKGVCLWLYFKFGHLLILKTLTSGMIDYNFSWTLPEWINNIFGISISGTFSDFIFWSGFILLAIFLITGIEKKLLTFLAKDMEVGWAKELIEEAEEKHLKSQETKEKVEEITQKEEVKDSEISVAQPLKEKIVLKPNFFKDRIWYQFFVFLSISLPPLILFRLLNSIPSFTDTVIKNSSNPLNLIFGYAILFVFLICLPFFLREISTRIILEKDKIIIKAFPFKKSEIYYSDIRNIYVGENGGLEIYHDKETKRKMETKVTKLSPWPFTMEKLLIELKPRLKDINIDSNFITDSIKQIKGARSLASILIVLLVILLFFGFIYYLINKEVNRPKFSDEECVDRLEFWINDQPKTKFLETKEGVNPKISIDAPFYLFINAKENIRECDKKISFTIYNTKGTIVFQQEELTPPVTGLINYSWTGILKEKGDYLLKINYGDIPAKEINFSVK